MPIPLRTFRKINLFLILFFGTSSLVYFFLNGGAYWREIRYQVFLSSPFASQELRIGNLLEVQEAAAGKPQSVGLAAGEKPYTLLIPRIEVETPLVVPRDHSKQAILASLEEGVGIYPGSVPAGDNGRLIALGHSSRASWYRGGYATVFSLLGKLEPGDEIYIIGGGKKYHYRVLTNDILTPADTNKALAVQSAEHELNLITCYPIGGASKRTVIRASLIGIQDIQYRSQT